MYCHIVVRVDLLKCDRTDNLLLSIRGMVGECCKAYDHVKKVLWAINNIINKIIELIFAFIGTFLTPLSINIKPTKSAKGNNLSLEAFLLACHSLGVKISTSFVDKP